MDEEVLKLLYDGWVEYRRRRKGWISPAMVDILHWERFKESVSTEVKAELCRQENQEYQAECNKQVEMSLLLNLSCCYNPLKKWLRGIGMPTIYPSRWNDYTIRVVSSSLLRQIVTIYSFLNTDPFPYFYSTHICYNLGIWRHGKTKGKELHYNWRLVKSISNEEIKGRAGDGTIKLHKLRIMNWKNEAIKVGRVSETGQYKLQVKITDKVGTSPYIDIAEFTIKDKDEFGVGLVWIVVSAIVGAIVGAIIRGI